MNILNISGLKCDNINCWYQDKTIKLEDYKQYINSHCPNCWEPLLTQADYNTVMKMIELYWYEIEYNGDKWKIIKIQWEMNGSWNLYIKDVKLEDR